MPNKKIILFLLLGYAVAIVLPPSKLFGMFGPKSQS